MAEQRPAAGEPEARRAPAERCSPERPEQEQFAPYSPGAVVAWAVPAG